MRVGVSLPMFDDGGRPLTQAGFRQGVATIAAAGFDSVWAFDTIGRGYFHPDPLTSLAAAAQVAPELDIGTSVLQLPLRNPIEVAQRAMTVQALTGGRLTLGIGAGSDARDFALLGRSFDDRFRALARDVPVLKAAMARDAAVAPPPPILIGAWGASRWVDRAATDFDGWIGSAAKTSLSVLTDGLRRFRAAGGRRAIAANLAVDLTVDAGPLADDQPLDLRCRPEEAGRRVALLADLGFDEIIVFTIDHAEDSLLELGRALT